MSDKEQPCAADLLRQNEELRQQLLEAEELITAIRTGAVDALAVQSAEGPRIFTLQSADQGYRTLIEQMNEGALLLSRDATVLYGNACLAGLLGLLLEEVIGCSFLRFVPAEFQAYWNALLEKGWEGKSRGEMPLQVQSGLLQPFSVSMNVLEFDGMPVLAVIITDLSAQQEIKDIRAQVLQQNNLLERQQQELQQQQQAQAAIAQAAAEASRMLEGIPQIAWTASPRGSNTYLNRQWFYYTGHDNGSPSANDIKGQIHPDDLPMAMARWRNSLTMGTALEVECRIKNHLGQYRWMLGRALPSRNEQGEIIQWIGTYTDIHEHRLAQERIDRAQRELQENNERLTRVNADLDNFIYTASHDLKAPINNIEGLLHALLSELETPCEEQVELLLDMMQDSVDRFKRTIEHLTEVTKLQKENDQPVATVDLATLIREVSLDLAPLVQEAGGALEVTVSSCPTISFAEKNLRSIIYNLLSNAFKYRSPERVSQVHIRSTKLEKYLLLEVQDNGLGLKEESAHKMFSMFQRFHDHVEGSGIGLYMVKKIVDNAGGRIEVQSQEGQGTTFSVYFKH
ncbi:HAMP domain-containing histidine kinase [Hymenobacter sp. HSC-4F20]|uniref:sensor histidine kinase n=1 Tax=Hymenobacter sp. HSC-4F20 TaxID=2864135 RepID=UPI001C72F7D7|nr:HAMP domain-containing sensor histidine kinase [Hymenobacter sp. HSC-4F20]MBX0290190.1 HAMP domain-containing histidine kinase [Hymenobacter sp. HSC-4F20]